ncbi:MAG: guanylate kinase [Sterolibacterium sp.]|nr:guanylate kinase [Sterolibacterium sp.]
MSGTLFIISAPSGAGKTTLVRELLNRDPRIHLSVSHTTRQPRPGEVTGRDYHFVGIDEFLAMRDRHEFLESAEVHGNFYGTSRLWLEQQLSAGHDVLLEIDWQGAQQVRRVFHDAIGIFLLPPSLAELEARLRGRGTDSDETIARRQLAALTEMRHVDEYEYVIINKDLQPAIEDLQAAVHASRLRLIVQRNHHPELFSLLFPN